MTASNDSFSNSSFPPEPSLDGPPIRTFVVDDDPIFRVGVRAWLHNYPEFEVIEAIGDDVSALPRLQEYLSNVTPAPTLVLLGGPLKMTEETSTRIYDHLLEWCRSLKRIGPEVMVVMIGAEHRETMAAAQRIGANGYIAKSGSPDDLLDSLRAIKAGQFTWPTNLIRPYSDGEEELQGLEERNPPALDPTTFSSQQRSNQRPASMGALAQLRFRLRLSGLEQIDDQLNQLLPHLQGPSSTSGYYVSVVDRWVIAGRCRELRAARWAVTRLLATPSLDALDVEAKYRPETTTQNRTPLTDGRSQSSNLEAFPAPVSSSSSMEPSEQASANVRGVLVRWQKRLKAIAQQPLYQATTDQPLSTQNDQSTSPQRSRRALSSQSGSNAPLVPSPPESPMTVRATLFESLRDRLQSPLLNQTEYPLEIDILREEKKRELLALILHKILVLLDDLRYSEVQPQQLQERRSQLFYDLWQAILTDYFGKYYVLQVDGIEQEVVTILTQDTRAVQEAIFDRIPFAVDLLAHFLFKSPLEIDSVPYRLGSPEAFERAELLLDNLVIQMGNSIIYPLLNHLSDVELIKQNFYQRQLMSSRDIARFRNTLSWHYRRKQWIDEPTHIFESRHTLFTLNSMGIKQASIYASRRNELDGLSGLPLLVTLLLEIRDALSPRLRGAIAAIGTGMIYVLTDVIGRAIGLVGRGIIKGIGSAWQDPKP